MKLALILNGKAWPIRYSYANGNGPLMHVLDIGDEETGPGTAGIVKDEFPDAMVKAGMAAIVKEELI